MLIGLFVTLRGVNPKLNTVLMGKGSLFFNITWKCLTALDNAQFSDRLTGFGKSCAVALLYLFRPM